MRGLLTALMIVTLSASSGCALFSGGDLTAEEIQEQGQQVEELGKITGAIGRRIFEISNGVPFSRTQCSIDYELIRQLTRLVTDLSDGGDATGSTQWALGEQFAGVLVAFGCQLPKDVSALLSPNEYVLAPAPELHAGA